MQQNKNFLFPLPSQKDLSLSDSLQLLAFEDYEGRIDLTSPQEHGQIFIKNGTPIHAVFASLKGDEALLKALEIPTITFNVTSTDFFYPQNIESSLEDLLIESAFRSQNKPRNKSPRKTKNDPFSSSLKSLLHIHLPTGEDFNFTLSQNEISIGRAQTNLLSIPEKSISGHHAFIFFRDGNYYIKDLHSANGTILNDKPIQESILKKGDTIQIGKVTLKFQSKLKRPDLQSISHAELKNPLKLKMKKNSNYDITTALRITDLFESDSKKKNRPLNKAAKKQIIFFSITLSLLLFIALYAYLKR